MAALTIQLDRVAKVASAAIPSAVVLFGALGANVSFYFHFGTVAATLLTALDTYYRYGQRDHSLLRNFGVLAQARYVLESIGPELRQYLFASDREERPFDRSERAEIYRKAKGVDSTAAFGTQIEAGDRRPRLLHSAYPLDHEDLEPYRLTFGEERGCAASYTIDRPIAISAMSYGALSAPAVRSLARGAKKAGIPMNTGEGGYPKYHLMEGCDLVFQMGTAKFGVRQADGTLDPAKLQALCSRPEVKMVEIKLSQGAKPGKGGILPKEKITDEIAELRNVSKARDVISPPRHVECRDAQSTLRFIRHVQEVSGLPVGIKLCLGRPRELAELADEMARQQVFPDYIAVDGAEGGTGAAPRSFMDDVGQPLESGLQAVHTTLTERGLRDRLKLIASGKLVTPARQIAAMARGADAVYSARGFLLAMGCIQALQCNANTCPVGLTTHDPMLIRGVDIERKSDRVANYVAALLKEHDQILMALGCASHSELTPEHIGEASAREVPASGSSPGFVPMARLIRGNRGVRV